MEPFEMELLDLHKSFLNEVEQFALKISNDKKQQEAIKKSIFLSQTSMYSHPMEIQKIVDFIDSLNIGKSWRVQFKRVIDSYKNLMEKSQDAYNRKIPAIIQPFFPMKKLEFDPSSFKALNPPKIKRMLNPGIQRVSKGQPPVVIRKPFVDLKTE